MITPAELQQNLEALGHPITVRRLTDWRTKGLLPPLESQGRGKGRGKTYFWNDPAIEVRALLLLDAFACNATADEAMLALVHAGFDIAPKKARLVWKTLLARAEKQSNQKVDPEETPRDFYWSQAPQFVAELSKPKKVSDDVMETLTTQALLTIYARSGFRPDAEELVNFSNSAKQYLTETMTDARHRRARRVLRKMLSKKRLVRQLIELIRQAMSVTATKELLKGTTVEQFDLAMGTTRSIIRATETFISTQMRGQAASEPSLPIRMIFRAIVAPRITAFFLQLSGAGYGQKLQKSLKLLEAFIATCEAHPGHAISLEKLEISQELQAVGHAIFLNLKEIWRDTSLFRVYHIA